ncbi:hypothetical protein ACWD4O_38900 [Streptomyces sp. NPDC002623]
MHTLPPMPEQDIPVIVQTSASYDTDDFGDLERHGIDPATDWWCETVRRVRRGDAIACLYPPGADRYSPLIELSLGAEDLYEAEAVGHRMIRLGRILVRLLADVDDQDAWQALKGKGLPNGYPRLVREWVAGYGQLGLQCPALTLDCAGRGGELWTISMVAERLGYSGPSATGSARKQLSRWGIVSQGREPGRRGQSQYLASEVQAACEAGPGKGRHGATRGTGGRFTPKD